MILEGIVTTRNEDGSVNISPMGPIVDPDMTHLVLRPFRTSTTYENLKRSSAGVLHVTDDVELMARAAVGRLETPPELIQLDDFDGVVLKDACRWYAFQVAALHDRQERTTIECKVVDHGFRRNFFGFNRAKHAVLEVAILATRIDLLPHDEIRQELQRLKVLVEKTAGDQERSAWTFLESYFDERLA